MLFAGIDVAEYRTAPHMQPPWMSWFKSLSPLAAQAYRCMPKKKSPA
jgi:hypothetical protein